MRLHPFRRSGSSRKATLLQRILCCGAFLVAYSAIALHAQATPAPSSERAAALALEHQGKLADAEIAWRAILKAHPRDPEPLVHLGLLAAHQEHYKDAAAFDRKALALNPHVAGLRLNLALALFKSEDLKGAIPEFETLLRSSPPGSTELLRYTILLGMSYYGLADYAHAAPYLQRAVDRDNSNLSLLLALAQSYLWSRQFSRALEVDHQILLINPDSAEADMIAGEALDEMKDNEGSTKMFRAAVKANPQEPNVHFGLGYLLWTQKQYVEAAYEFQAELANDPDHEQSLLYLGDTDIQLNRLADAQPLLERAAKMNPALGLAHLDLGIIYSDAGRNSDTLKELNLAAKQIPNDVDVHWRLGRLYRALGKKEEAKAEFDKAISLNEAADHDLYQKIAHGQSRSPFDVAPTPASAPATQP